MTGRKCSFSHIRALKYIRNPNQVHIPGIRCVDGHIFEQLEADFLALRTQKSIFAFIPRFTDIA